MAIKQSTTFRNATANGTFGNLNKEIAFADLAADAVNDVTEVLRLEAGTTITGMAIHHGALGAGTGIKVGVSYFDDEDGTADDDAFATIADASAEGTKAYECLPITFEVPVKLTVTVTGAAATGRVTVVPEYIYKGPN